MLAQKEKIILTKEQETLLIPLYAKATEKDIFNDPKAQEILSCVDYDFARLNTPRKTSITLCIRAANLDAYTQDFLSRHPQSVILHLGCGLDSRVLRVEHPQAEWYDLDMPDVIELRGKFYPAGEHYHLIASSVTRLEWINQVHAQGRPVLVITEGLLMYLSETDVKALFLALRKAFPGCELACDVYSTLTAKSASRHPSLSKTGATIQWGVDEAKGIEGWAEGIRLKQEWYFTQSEAIDKLGAAYKLAFKLASLFATANKAHRIVYYQL